MAAMLSFGSTTSKAKPLVRDKFNQEYKINRRTEKVNYWICRKVGCNARIRARVSTNNLIGDSLPTHA